MNIFRKWSKMTAKKNPRYYLGDSCICWSFGNEISPEISSRVLAAYETITKATHMSKLGVFDLVPSYNELAVYFDPVKSSVNKIIKSIEKSIETSIQSSANEIEKSSKNRKSIIIPVVYNGEDLERVAELNHLTISDVIHLHTSVVYTVAMVGFLPHFPYLIGLDKKLVTSRLDSPRTLVPAGSVAIGGAQTGIYPQDSPGGWNILGQTDTALLKPIKPADIIEFRSVKEL